MPHHSNHYHQIAHFGSSESMEMTRVQTNTLKGLRYLNGVISIVETIDFPFKCRGGMPQSV
jgi:hypothetical protein